MPDACVDLIYADPPFNSKRLYNAYIGGAQWEAFNDTWRWHEAVDDFHEIAADADVGPTMEGAASHPWWKGRILPTCPTWLTGCANAGAS